MRIRNVIVLALFAAAVRLSAETPASVEILGPAGARRVTAAELAGMKRSKVTISDHGVSAAFEGVPLADLLALAGAPSGDKLRGPGLLQYVLVEAADSYRAAFTLVELDRAFTDRVVILADTRDGKPLSAKEGPFRIIVEGEKKQARCVRQVTRLRIGAIE